MNSLTARIGVIGLLGVAMLVGCSKVASVTALKNPFKSEEDKVVENVKAALRGEEGHSKLVGDYISVRNGLQMFAIEGVGLVVGLDGTGGDPGPPYREALLEDMRKRRFPRPEEFLRSPDTALVLVRAYVPPLVRPQDPLDIEIRVPEGSSTTSLRGGRLLECNLTELAFAPGRGMLEGRKLAVAQGAVLPANLGDEDNGGAFLRGHIPGGARYVGKGRDLSVQLRPDYAYHRMAIRIADRIGARFHDYDPSGIQQPLAEAKSNSRIELKVHSRYRDNYPRYLQCIRHIHLKESTVQRNVRMQRLAQELVVPETSMRASLELEAIGREALPFLKSGLEAATLECRFHAAQALCYLGDTSGIPALVEATDKEPAFRIYALAAIAATMNPEGMIRLQPLLSHKSVETKYGAFRAMTTIAPDDPLVAGVDMKGGYRLHLLQTDGEPVVHITQRKKQEVVLFDSRKPLRAPLVLRAGSSILIRSNPTGDRLLISVLRKDRDPIRVSCSTMLADLLSTLDELGANYPQVVQMLVEADRQGNLPGPLGIDTLPQPGRTYRRPSADGTSDDVSVGTMGEAPPLFDNSDPALRATEFPSEEFDEEPPEGLEESLDSVSVDPVGFTVQ